MHVDGTCLTVLYVVPDFTSFSEGQTQASWQVCWELRQKIPSPGENVSVTLQHKTHAHEVLRCFLSPLVPIVCCLANFAHWAPQASTEQRAPCVCEPQEMRSPPPGFTAVSFQAGETNELSAPRGANAMLFYESYCSDCAKNRVTKRRASLRGPHCVCTYRPTSITYIHTHMHKRVLMSHSCPIHSHADGVCGLKRTCPGMALRVGVLRDCTGQCNTS